MHIFMLPDPEHSPPVATEPAVGIPVALSITGNLGRPVISVYLMQPHAMERATVPKAAIHEHCQPLTWKDNIHLPPLGTRHDRQVQPVTKAPLMQGLPEFEFRAGALRSLLLHPASDARA